MTGAMDSRALAGLLLGALCIGLSGIFVKLADIGPQACGFYRIFASAPAFWLWLWLAPRAGAAPQRALGRQEWRLILVTSLVIVGDYGTWHASLRLTSVANATLLANLVPIFVALHAAIFLRRAPRSGFLVAMVVTLAGAALLMRDSIGLSSERLLGDALAVVTAMFYAAYVVLVARLRAAISTARLMAWTGTLAGPLFLPLALLAGESIIPASPSGWLTVLGLVLICQVAGSGLIAYALAHLPATFSALTLLLQPVFSAIAAALVLGERLGPVELFGGALVLTGVYLARRTS